MVPTVKTVTLLMMCAALMLALVSAKLFAQDDTPPPGGFAIEARGTPGEADPPAAVVSEPGVVVVKRAITAEEFERRALKWISVGGTVITAVLGLLFGIWVRVTDMRRQIEKSREEDLERMQRQSIKTGSLETRLTALAMATPAGAQTLRATPAPAPEAVTIPPLKTTPEASGGKFAGLAAGALIVGIMHLSACATDTGDPVKDARGRATNQALVEATKVLGRMAASAIFTTARNELQGGNADMGDSAAAGLWANVNSADTGAAVARVMRAYSGGTVPKTAATASAAATQAIGEGKPAPEVVNAIATVVSVAAEDERE